MKDILGILLAVTALVFAPLRPTLAEQPMDTKLMVTVTGIRADSGTIKIGLFNKQTGFPDIARAMRGIDIPARKGQVVAVFTGLPAGQYAVAIIHDENNDGILDKNFLGIPREGYGFSYNAKPPLGTPEFSETSLRLDGETTHITIDMKH